METDHHHIWFNRRWYGSSKEKEFRNFTGFVILTHIPVHRDLHAQISPPPKLPVPVMRNLLDHLGNFNYDYRNTLLRTVDFLAAEANEALLEHQHHHLQAAASNVLAQCNLLFPYQEEAA